MASTSPMFVLEPASSTHVSGDLVLFNVRSQPPGISNSAYLAIWDANGIGTFTTLPSQSTPNSASILFSVNGKQLMASLLNANQQLAALWETTGVPVGNYPVTVTIYDATELSGSDQGSDPAKKLASLTAATGPLQGFSSSSPPPQLTGVGLLLGSRTANVTLTDVPTQQVTVQMRRAFEDATPDQALWTAIRKSTNALSFNNYNNFMEVVLCGGDPSLINLDSPAAIHHIRNARDPIKHRLRLPFPDTDAYRQLKVATEVFVMLNCGVSIDHPGFASMSQADLDDEGRRYYRAVGPGDIETAWSELIQITGKNTAGDLVRTLPYLDIIRRKLGDVAVVKPVAGASVILQAEEAVTECMGILMRKLTHPCLLELIWSYWHEEGMLAQTMNAITWRFQNRHSSSDRDPLAMLEIDPLRPLNNFLWGYVQDEQHRLSVPRRAYEYDHHYGLNLVGKAVPWVRGADTRSRFLEAFHNLLFLCSIFYKEDDDTTVVADGFPILNALKEVHLLLTQGAHNQYGDLPWTARQEMLMQEWLLARPEFREYLPSRIMVDYPEPWMDRVETMKTLQGWSNTSILHFRDLGVFGEQILLGIRFGAWPSVIEPQFAANWARYWRPEIQGYYHGYRAVTGVDLTERVDATLPSLLLTQRLQQSLPPPNAPLPGPAAQVRIGAMRTARALPRSR